MSLTFGLLETANAQTQPGGREIGWSLSNPGGGPVLPDHDPGATVHFEVSNNEGIQSGLVLMRIVGTTHDLLGYDVFYQEGEELVNGKADFSYTIPENATNMPYRMVANFTLLSQNSGCCSVEFFITGNKDKMVLSDLNITRNFNLTRQLNFRFLVTNGVNEPVLPLKVVVSVPYTKIGTSQNITSSILQSPSMSAMIQGNLTLPTDFQYGIHYMIINASEISNSDYRPINAKITFDLSDTGVHVMMAKINGQDIQFHPQPLQMKVINATMATAMQPLQNQFSQQNEEFTVLTVGLSVAAVIVIGFIIIGKKRK